MADRHRDRHIDFFSCSDAFKRLVIENAGELLEEILHRFIIQHVRMEDVQQVFVFQERTQHDADEQALCTVPAPFFFFLPVTYLERYRVKFCSNSNVFEY